MLSWRACFLTEPAYQLPTSRSYFWSTAPGPLSQAVLLSSWLLTFLIPRNSSLNSRLGPDCSRIQSTFFLGRRKTHFPCQNAGTGYATELLVPETRNCQAVGFTQRTGFSTSVTLWQPQRVMGEWNSAPQGNDGEDGMRGDQLGGPGSQQAPGMCNLLSFLSVILPGRPWMFLFHQAKPTVANSCFGICWGPQILGWEEGGTFWDLPGTAYRAETYGFQGGVWR